MLVIRCYGVGNRFLPHSTNTRMYERGFQNVGAVRHRGCNVVGSGKHLLNRYSTQGLQVTNPGASDILLLSDKKIRQRSVKRNRMRFTKTALLLFFLISGSLQLAMTSCSSSKSTSARRAVPRSTIRKATKNIKCYQRQPSVCSKMVR